MALPTATALDIINEAFRDVGIKGTGRNLTAEDISTGLRRLNWLISQWNQKKIFIYHMVELSLTSTGALSYTCGPGGDFPFVDAPRKMDSAFVRLINSGIPVDRSLGIIQSKEDYDRISLKSMGTIPSWVYLDENFPVATVYFWPVPVANIYELHISVPMVLATFPTPATAVSLPPEYFAALQYALALRICSAYRIEASKELIFLARDAENTLVKANYKQQLLRMPQGLVRDGVYNIYTDSFN